MGDPAGHVAREALRRLQHRPEADPAAPVVAEQAGAVDPLRVQQREQVLDHARLAVVAVGREARPAQPAQVRDQDPVLAGQRLDHAPPAVPVLREAVQGDERRRVGGPGAGHVHAHARGEVAADVFDPRQLGQRRHAGTG
jgi:hypothetical protein